MMASQKSSDVPAPLAYDSETDEDLEMFEAHEDDEIVHNSQVVPVVVQGQGGIAQKEAFCWPAPYEATGPKKEAPVDQETFLGRVSCFQLGEASRQQTSVNIFPAQSSLITAGPRDRLGKTPPPPVTEEPPPKVLKRKRVRLEWTEEEDRLFLEGLRLHGTQWALIDDMIPSRTRTQIRTHYRYYTRTLENNTINDLYGVGKKIKLRQRGRPRLRLRHRQEEAEQLMPQLVQDILSTVRTLHERHLKDTVKLMPKKSPPVRKVRPHDNLCAKFVVGVDQLIPVRPKVPAPPPILLPQVRPMVVPGRPLAPAIQTVDSSCSVTTNVFGGLTLARDIEPRARNTGLAVVVKKEPTDEDEKECTAGSSRRAEEESPETTAPGADVGETAGTTVVEEDDGDEEELRVAE